MARVLAYDARRRKTSDDDFAVGDLSSGQEVLWASIGRQNATATQRRLLELPLNHGVPLVLTLDNGSALIGEVAEDLL